MRKAQAAMEFLMTYGWAILVVLIAIGALAYFGVLNPSKFLPSSCTLQPGLDCSEFKVQASDNTVHLFVRNGMGESVDFSALGIDTNSDGDTADATDCAAIDPASIADGAMSAELTITCPDAQVGTVGSRFKGDLIGTYIKGTSTLTHTLSGSITSEAE